MTVKATTPDEANGIIYARTVHEHGLGGLGIAAGRYVDEQRGRYPSPLRWGWVLWLSAVLDRGVPHAVVTLALLVGIHHFFGPLAVVVTCGAPLLCLAYRKVLPDAVVGISLLGAVLAAQAGNPVALAGCLFVATSFREASLLAVPALAAAWLMGHHSPAIGAEALAGATLAWLLVTAALLGRHLRGTLRAALGGHASAYTLEHQRGAPHRLLVDLVLVSPVATLLAVLGVSHDPTLAVAALLIFVAHAASPVRNVRTILVVDLLLRLLAFKALVEMPPVQRVGIAALCLATDVYIYTRIRNVIDPATAWLVKALEMHNPPALKESPNG